MRAGGHPVGAERYVSRWTVGKSRERRDGPAAPEGFGSPKQRYQWRPVGNRSDGTVSLALWLRARLKATYGSDERGGRGELVSRHGHRDLCVCVGLRVCVICVCYGELVVRMSKRKRVGLKPR